MTTETNTERLKRCKRFADADDIIWLIQQAEKVQDLDMKQFELTSENDRLYKTCQSLRTERFRIKTALEFYADEENWYYDLNSNVMEDWGNKARQALGVESHVN